MMRLKSLLLLIAFCSPCVAAAADRAWGVIGSASMFNNDYFGDGEDRWRTASRTMSVFHGPGWAGSLPNAGWPLVEVRLRGEIMAPTHVYLTPTQGERPLVGVFAPGVFALFSRNKTDFRVGGELTFTGPRTGVIELMEYGHRMLGYPLPNRSREFGNHIFPTLSAEAARIVDLYANNFRLRPFVEAQAGAETFLRFGFDAVAAADAGTTLYTRDPVTGHLMTAARIDDRPAWIPIIGADIAYVVDSRFLPASAGIVMDPLRARLRLGIGRMSAKRQFFFGLAWLSPEYTAQNEGQVVGSLTLRFRF